ncbi:MAG TPA: PQQ-binding-like beta-propeller repeat protein, partial [Lacipirellulaceae bacterium]|nr:PQQ-binding-like beta-propeller repeat protein [Lacipirellulaceae bacterium]
MRRLLLLTLATAAGLSCGDAVGADAWPRFRGPHGAGQSDAAGIPAVWTDADYAWRVALPGLGHSSPVVWNGRVFVTSADRDSAELYVACFDLATGRELWQRRLPGGPHAMHRVNSYATSTPAVDDRHLYVAWKAGDAVLLAALTHEGRDVWQRQTGRLDETHGFGASPIVVGDVVCLPNDTDAAADSAIVGVDRRTGEILWRSPCGSAKTSYATPLAWETPDGETLILAASVSDGLTA